VDFAERGEILQAARQWESAGRLATLQEESVSVPLVRRPDEPAEQEQRVVLRGSIREGVANCLGQVQE